MSLITGASPLQNINFIAPSSRKLYIPSHFLSLSRPHYLICSCRAEKGERHARPRVWKKPKRRGTSIKAIHLIKTISAVSDVREDVYGALDAWSAFELEFPIVAVKKALRILRDQWQWKRVIQVSKWMLAKGHGKTMSTYQLLMQALEKDERIEEAEEIFQGVFRRYMDALPRSHFALMIGIYYRAGMYEKLLDVFADMEELKVRPDKYLVDLVAEVYTKIGMPDKSEKVLIKYPPRKWEYRYVKGKRIKVPTKRLYPATATTENATMEEESTGDVSEEEAENEGSEGEEEEEDEINNEHETKQEAFSDLHDRALLGDPVPEELLEASWQCQASV